MRGTSFQPYLFFKATSSTLEPSNYQSKCLALKIMVCKSGLLECEVCPLSELSFDPYR